MRLMAPCAVKIVGRVLVQRVCIESTPDPLATLISRNWRYLLDPPSEWKRGGIMDIPLDDGIRIRLARKPYFARARVGSTRYIRSCCGPHSVIAEARFVTYLQPFLAGADSHCSRLQLQAFDLLADSKRDGPDPREEASTNQ